MPPYQGISQEIVSTRGGEGREEQQVGGRKGRRKNRRRKTRERKPRKRKKDAA